MTRVAGANTAMWSDIYSANRAAIVAEIRRFRSELERVEELFEGEDTVGWNDRARADRRSLLEAGVPGGEVHELRLTVPNRPGIVAQVALELGGAGVNIVDMALAPAADMRSGAMTLWIAGDSQAARARGLIAALGFGRRRAAAARASSWPGRSGWLHPAGNKSISHRAALFAAMCDEPVTVRNYLDSADALHPRRRAHARGGRGGGGQGVRGDPRRRPARAARGHRRPLERGQRRHADAAPAGAGSRGPGGIWTLDGDESIRRRPVDRVAEPLQAMGAGVEVTDGRFPPFTVTGTTLTGIDYACPCPARRSSRAS